MKGIKISPEEVEEIRKGGSWRRDVEPGGGEEIVAHKDGKGAIRLTRTSKGSTIPTQVTTARMVGS